MNFEPEGLRRAQAVLAAREADFATLARIANLDPTRHFRQANLRNIDFGSDDLTHFDFSGSDLSGADLSRTRGLNISRLLGVQSDSRTRWPPAIKDRIHKNIFDRAAERIEIVNLVQSGTSVVVRAFRRAGKSWLLHKLGDDLRDLGWTVLWVDAQGLETEEDFVRNIVRNVIEYSPPISRTTLDSSRHFDGLLFSKLGEYADRRDLDRKLNSLGDLCFKALSGWSRRTTIIVDEFQWLVDALERRNPGAAERFLIELRRIRMEYPKIRWILSENGELEFRSPSAQAAMVDINVFPLEPFTRAEARSFMDFLVSAGEAPQSFALDNKAFALLADEVGWLTPFCLRIAAREIHPSGSKRRDGRRLATEGDVRAAVDRMVEMHYFDSLVGELNARGDLSTLIFTGCAVDPKGAELAILKERLRDAAGQEPSEESVQRSLEWLVDAGYLVNAESHGPARYRVPSSLIRRAWLNSSQRLEARGLQTLI